MEALKSKMNSLKNQFENGFGLVDPDWYLDNSSREDVDGELPKQLKEG